MDISINSIAVTGATGIIGNSLLELLSNYPTVTVYAIGNSNIALQKKYSNIHYIKLDLEKEELPLDEWRCEALIHLAAQSGGVLSSSKNPWLQVSQNIAIDNQIFRTIASHPQYLKNFIYASTSSAYPNLDKEVHEHAMDFNIDPMLNHFGVGWVKRFGEKMCDLLAQQYPNLQICIPRFSNVYGPCARFDPLYANFIPALIRKALERQEPFEIWGSPDVTRDVLFANDAASALLAMLTAPAQKEAAINTPRIFNVGAGKTVTVAEVADQCCIAAGFTPQRQIYTNANSQTIASKRVLNCTKINQELGWQATTSLSEGIAFTTKWWKENRTIWTK